MKLGIKEEIKLVAKMYKTQSMRQIGKKLLLSHVTVKRRLSLLDIKPRTSNEGVKLASKQGRLNAKRKRVNSNKMLS